VFARTTSRASGSIFYGNHPIPPPSGPPRRRTSYRLTLLLMVVVSALQGHYSRRSNPPAARCKGITGTSRLHGVIVVTRTY